MIVLDGTANTVTPLNGALGATTPSTVAATTVVASSTIKGATTIAVGNATPSASGAGITFPATQSASTDVNTLDDYEEGTWTPTWSVSGGTITANGWASGKYTKIGSTVFLWGYLSYGSHTGTPSGGLSIASFPFPVGGGFGQSNTFGGGLTISSGGLWGSGMPSFVDLKPGTNTGTLLYNNASGNVATTFANMSQNSNYSQFIFFGQYTV